MIFYVKIRQLDTTVVGHDTTVVGPSLNSSDSEIYLQNFELPKIVPIENPPTEQQCLKQQLSPGEIFITENFTPPPSPPNQKTIRILIHHEEPKVVLPPAVNRKRKRRTKKPDEISRKVEVAENFDLGDYLGIQNAIENRDFHFSDFSSEDDEKRIKLFFENTEPRHHIHPQAFIECGNGKFHHGIGRRFPKQRMRQLVQNPTYVEIDLLSPVSDAKIISNLEIESIIDSRVEEYSLLLGETQILNRAASTSSSEVKLTTSSGSSIDFKYIFAVAGLLLFEIK